VAACDLADTATLATVLDGAHTVVHLAGGLDLPDEAAYETANLGTVQDTLEACVDSGVTRFVLLSYPGASPAAANPYLGAKGRAEAAVADSGLEGVILRCTHVYGPGQRWLRETRAAATRPLLALVIGSGAQRVAPVFVDDVGRAIVAADDRASSIEGTLGVQGPDELTADELADVLAGRRRRKLHLGPRAAHRASRVQGRRVSITALEILAADSVTDVPDAAEEFRLSRTGLRAGLIRSGVLAGR
jgi:NADH dehydrogenase